MLCSTEQVVAAASAVQVKLTGTGLADLSEIVIVKAAAAVTRLLFVVPGTVKLIIRVLPA